MSSKVDMSLDDIISKNKSNRGRGGRGRGRGGRGAVSSRGTSAGRGARSRGRVMRNTRGRRSGPFGNSSGFNNNINGRWSHDMYYGGTGSVSSMKASPGPAKLNISNLEYGVSDSDIKELFCEFGNMRSATVHYDRTGRSLGSAQVVFERRQDAMKAIRQYNGVHLDGRPMHIEMDGQSGGGFTNGSSPVKRLQAGPRSTGGRGGARGTPRRFGRGGRGTTRGGASRGGRGRVGRGRGGRGRGAKATKVPTAEELDAELDDYVMQASN